MLQRTDAGWTYDGNLLVVRDDPEGPFLALYDGQDLDQRVLDSQRMRLATEAEAGAYATSRLTTETPPPADDLDVVTVETTDDEPPPSVSATPPKKPRG